MKQLGQSAPKERVLELASARMSERIMQLAWGSHLLGGWMGRYKHGLHNAWRVLEQMGACPTKYVVLKCIPAKVIMTWCTSDQVHISASDSGQKAKDKLVKSREQRGRQQGRCSNRPRGAETHGLVQLHEDLNDVPSRHQGVVAGPAEGMHGVQQALLCSTSALLSVAGTADSPTREASGEVKH